MGNSANCCEAQAPNNQTDIVTSNLTAGDETNPAGKIPPPAALQSNGKAEDAKPNGQATAEQVPKPVAAPPTELKMGEKFTVTLDKGDGQKLGFGLTRIGETVTVNEIKAEGAIVKYNDDNPTKKVQLEDIINSINGSSSKLDDIKSVVASASGSITMEMERPKIWLAKLEIPKGSLGVEFGDAQKVYIPITSVDAAGPVADFNAANPGYEIAAGDFIIKTDTLKKDGPKMLAYIKEKTAEGSCMITCTLWRNLPG
jgi:hypothetical protein